MRMDNNDQKPKESHAQQRIVNIRFSLLPTYWKLRINDFVKLTNVLLLFHNIDTDPTPICVYI